VRLARPITESNIDEFATGLVIDNGDICRPAELAEAPSPPDDGAAACAYITITEGMYHQVKRMFSSVGNEVLYLKRIQTGGLALPDGLKPGECVELTETDIELLFQQND
jgi:16S rRNA pseudouridine516 synthase